MLQIDILHQLSSGNFIVAILTARNVKKGSALLEDEIFGPILPIMTVDSVEDAVKVINTR